MRVVLSGPRGGVASMASGVLTALQQACRKSVRAAMLMRKAWQARGVAHGVAWVIVRCNIIYQTVSLRKKQWFSNWCLACAAGRPVAFLLCFDFCAALTSIGRHAQCVKQMMRCTVLCQDGAALGERCAWF